MSDELMKQVALSMAGAFGSMIIGLMWKLVGAVVELNKKIAVICSTVDSHEKRIDKLENV